MAQSTDDSNVDTETTDMQHTRVSSLGSLASRAVPTVFAGGPRDSHNSVSYTHLDVYKRQILTYLSATRHKSCLPIILLHIYVCHLALFFLSSCRISKTEIR